MDMKINKQTLRAYRESKAWTQAHLAEVANLSLRTVQRIERSGDGSQESVLALAAALNIEVQDLVVGSSQNDASAGGSAVEVNSFPKNPLFQLWKLAAVIALLISTLGWWSIATAAPIKIQLMTQTASGLYGTHEFESSSKSPFDVVEKEKFKLSVITERRGSYLLIKTAIYEFQNGEYQLTSSPAVMVESGKISSLKIASPVVGELSLSYSATY